MALITEDEYITADEENLGWCRKCNAFTSDFAEPDAENYECPDCGNDTVYGAQQALLLGLIRIK